MVSNKGGCVCASPPPRYKNTLHFFFFVHPGSWIFATFFSFIGYEKYNTIRADPALCFLERVGKPDEKAVAAEQRANDYMDGYGRECFGASKQANLNLHAVPYSLPNWFYMMSSVWCHCCEEYYFDFTAIEWKRGMVYQNHWSLGFHS